MLSGTGEPGIASVGDFGTGFSFVETASCGNGSTMDRFAESALLMDRFADSALLSGRCSRMDCLAKSVLLTNCFAESALLSGCDKTERRGGGLDCHAVPAPGFRMDIFEADLCITAGGLGVNTGIDSGRPGAELCIEFACLCNDFCIMAFGVEHHIASCGFGVELGVALVVGDLGEELGIEFDTLGVDLPLVTLTGLGMELSTALGDLGTGAFGRAEVAGAGKGPSDVSLVGPGKAKPGGIGMG